MRFIDVNEGRWLDQANGFKTGIRPLDDWGQKMGKVERMLASPCNFSPMLMVQAYFHGLPYLAWNLFKPDPLDSKHEQFGQSCKHNRRGRTKKSIMYLGKKIHLNGKEWAVFKLGELANKIGWYFCVIDAEINFAIHWTSAMYTWSGCPVPSEADGYAEFGHAGYSAPVNDRVADWINPKSTRFVQMGGTLCTVSSQKTPMMVAHVEVEPTEEGADVHVSTIRIVEIPSGRIVSENTREPGSTDRGLMTSYTPMEFLSFTRQYRVEFDIGGHGLCRGSSGFWQVFAEANFGFTGDP